MTNEEREAIFSLAKEDYITTNPLDVQQGGSHYKNMEIQPIVFNQLNKIPWCEANIIKYVCRHSAKNGLEDLLKAKHYIDVLISLEYGEN